MSVCIIMGSPNKNGNTMELLNPLLEVFTEKRIEFEYFFLYEMKILPCFACRACQNDWNKFGCVCQDDVHIIFDSLIRSNLILLATPIYSWYCTPPMKALLDRLVYGMNKYYGNTKGPSLWEGKRLALLTTCGYRPEKGADLWETGIKRYCKHSKLQYAGMIAERHMGYHTTFMDGEKAANVKQFAKILLSLQSGK
ncbi:MAG: flavodoxin family protein [Firmicutes bacterium]|nr:flavodoxin family protein [Bacillota bacterium]